MTDHPTLSGGQAGDGAQPFETQPFETQPFEAMPDGTGERPCASYTLRVNGGERPVADAWIGESLLFVLRERLGLAGAKDGCEQGECGACSVQVDGQLVASCLVPAALAAGSDIQTVEGLAPDGAPSDVQQALAVSGAVQCGYCVPGLAMAVHDLLQRNHRPSDVEAREALCGNLCRCTGYRGVLDAVHSVAEARTAAVAALEARAEQEAEAAAAEQQAPAPGPVPAEPAGFPAAAAAVPYDQEPDLAPVYTEIPPQQFAEPLPDPATVAQPAAAPVDPLFGPLDAVLEAAVPNQQQPMHSAPAGYGTYGTYAPDPYGTGVYAEQPYGEGAYRPDPYRQSLGADTAPVPVLYTPDGQAAYDPAHGLGPQYGAPPDHGTPPHGTPAHGITLPEDDRA
ncbi:(2Fe-2S)-binding protein [Peterkaempfera sp. SMS 1(5)a]|uniref:(2Fe-2S)-binding protein n=1 Tax=Peterkaempfera podocarpi TaxID=3232308 RepID=UPI00366DACDB